MNSLGNNLQKKGFYLKSEWIDQQLKSNSTANPEEFLYETALKTDLCICSSGAPFLNQTKSVSYSMQSLVVLQIQSIVNIASPKDSQFVDTSNRMLKMKLTDGKITLYGIEYASIPSLSVSLQPGTKIAVQNVKVLNGLLLLNATNTYILGGSTT